MNNKSDYSGVEIAVIGISCRFPGARNQQEFWSNLTNGIESVSFLTDEEIFDLRVDQKILSHEKYVRSKGAVLSNKHEFDYDFFHYSQYEAIAMDPQMRVMHEVVWEALEDAGYDPHTYNGKIGLISGVTPNYSWLRTISDADHGNHLGYFHSSTLFEKDYASLNVAYKLNLKGPCFNIYTACSSSLVAIHQACRALLTGESGIMVAGGVSLSTEKSKGYIYQEGMILSRDGHCRAFDKSSSGTVVGEGAGFVVLKKLKSAIEDRDNIYAVIRGSAVNNDGSRKVGFFAPSVNGQKEVIQSAQAIARVRSDTITYVEAHGTATLIGDPIEVAGLTQAFNTDRKQFCAIGSVKTNIGHLDAAAGVAGFIKTILCLKNKTLVPSLHYVEPNPQIDFSVTPFFVSNKTMAWSNDMDALRAGVSSFGIGGTNAHIIVENYDSNFASSTIRPELLVVSAKTENALKRLKNNLNLFNNEILPPLHNLAFVLQEGRANFFVKDFIISDNVYSPSLFDHSKACDPRYSSIVLVIADFKEGQQFEIEEIIKHNKGLEGAYDEFRSLIEEKYKCTYESFLKSLSKDVGELLNWFVCNYILLDFLDKTGAFPKTLIVCGKGELLLCCIKRWISIDTALNYLTTTNIPEIFDFKRLFSYTPGTLEHINKYYISSTQSFNIAEIIDQAISFGYLDNVNNKLIAVVGHVCYEDNTREKKDKILQLLAPGFDLINYRNILWLIGTLWKDGYFVDFNCLNQDSTRTKISIPTYPFEPTIISKPQHAEFKDKDSLSANLFYNMAWQKIKNPFFQECFENKSISIALTDNTIFEQELIANVSADLANVRIIDRSNDYLEKFIRLISHSESKKVNIIILIGFKKQALPLEHLENDFDAYFFETLSLIRSLAEALEKKFSLNIITDKCFNVSGAESNNPALSGLKAIADIIPLEISNISCRVIDLNQNLFNNQSIQLVRTILDTQYDTERVLAVRNDAVWKRTLQPYKPGISKGISYIKDNNCYIITGGFGGMGYVIAKNILTSTSANLILLGRRDATVLKEENALEFDELFQFGKRVSYLQVDVGNKNELLAAYNNICDLYGSVKGIFHTAGLADYGGVVLRRTDDSIRQVWKSKVNGTINLFRLFSGPHLDFFVLFSSVGNYLYRDKIGQIAYNAGNEFLESFCQYSNRITTINWGDWSERGMSVVALAQDKEEKINNIDRLEGLSNSEAMNALNQMMSDDGNNITIYKGDLFADFVGNPKVKREHIQHQRPYLQQEAIIPMLNKYFKEKFDIEVIDNDKSFFDMGADSLVIIDSIPTLNILFDIKLSINDFYAYSSVNELSSFIVNVKTAAFKHSKEQIAVKFGDGKDIIFAFPPAIGLGFLAYSTMQELLPNFTIYAFNFLPAHDRITQYTDFINRILPTGKCSFFGYSSGGTLAYEVAKRVRKNAITHLVILDTYIYRLRFTKDKNERASLRLFLQNVREKIGEDLYKLLAPAMVRYYFFVNNLITKGKIDANIHLIKATDREAEEAANLNFLKNHEREYDYRPWSELTKLRYEEYDGYGSHNEMLEGVNYKLNIEILSKILSLKK